MTSRPPSSLVTAIVVAYNGGTALLRCVSSLMAQSIDGLRILVVDNASTDGSVEKLRAMPGVVVMRNPRNLGYSAAANIGWRSSRSKYVVILNQDLYLADTCIEELHRAAAAVPRDSLVSPLLLLSKDPRRINAAGNAVHFSGVAWCNGLNQLAADWSGTILVPAISGAAFITRRSLLERLDGLEESYFMYCEDVDLSLRARASGVESLVACDAIAVHDWSLRLSPTKFEWIERNRHAMWRRFWGTQRRMKAYLWQAELMAWLYALGHGAPYLKAKWRASRSPLTLPHVPHNGYGLASVLTSHHPYELLFPGNRFAQRAGQLLDRAIAAIGGDQSQSDPPI